MKKKMIITLGVLLLIVFVYFKYCRGVFVHVVDSYKIVSNTRKVIPAKMLLENSGTSIVKDSVYGQGYIVVFDDSLDFGSFKTGFLGPQVLIIDPKAKYIGEADLFRAAFIKINSKLYYQRSKNMHSKGIGFFPGLYEDPPIKYVHFEGNKVVFNTYGPLKQFGDTIILEIGK